MTTDVVICEMKLNDDLLIEKKMVTNLSCRLYYRKYFANDNNGISALAKNVEVKI